MPVSRKFNASRIESSATQTPEKQLKRAQMTLLTQEPFIATVMLNFKHEFDDTVPTAKASIRGFKYNTEFFTSLNPHQQVFLIAHEVWHVALDHISKSRIGNRQPMTWNMAGDYVINAMLKEQIVGERPPGGLFDRKYRNLSTEAVYDKLLKDDPPPPPDEGFGNPNDIDPSALTPEEEMKINEVIVKAAEEAKKQETWGSLPSHIKEMVESILQPQHDWKAALRRFVTERTKNDYSWARPNRRHPDIYMPSLYSESPRCVVVAVDTSGSISQDELMAFMTEIKAVHEDAQPIKTHIIDVDTEVNQVWEYGAHDYIPNNLEFSRGGGTYFHPAFEYADEHDPSCMIYLTDLYANDPNEPDYPTLWVSTTHHKKGPFGETTYLTV